MGSCALSPMMTILHGRDKNNNNFNLIFIFMEKKKRLQSSARIFNAYINKVIEVFRTTNEYKALDLRKEYGCVKLPYNRFIAMRLNEVQRELTIDETNIIFEHVREPRKTTVPEFDNTSDCLVWDNNNDNDVEDTKEEDVAKEGICANILNKVKDAILGLFKKKPATGFYLQCVTEGNREVFVWRNSKGKLDFLLSLCNNQVENYGRVLADAEIQDMEFGGVNIKQAFRVAYFLKVELDKKMRENDILNQRIDAIAQILLIEDEKAKKDVDLFGNEI